MGYFDQYQQECENGGLADEGTFLRSGDIDDVNVTLRLDTVRDFSNHLKLMDEKSHKRFLHILGRDSSLSEFPLLKRPISKVF